MRNTRLFNIANVMELYTGGAGGELCLEALKIGIPKPWDLLDLLGRIFLNTIDN